MLIHQGKLEKAGNRSEDMRICSKPSLLQLSSLIQLLWPSCQCIHSFTTSCSCPAPIPGTRLRNSPPYRDVFENSVLVPGAQGTGLVSPANTQQGTQFRPGDTPGAAQFPAQFRLLPLSTYTYLTNVPVCNQSPSTGTPWNRCPRRRL